MTHCDKGFPTQGVKGLGQRFVLSIWMIGNVSRYILFIHKQIFETFACTKVKNSAKVRFHEPPTFIYKQIFATYTCTT